MLSSTEPGGFNASRFMGFMGFHYECVVEQVSGLSRHVIANYQRYGGHYAAKVQLGVAESFC